MNQDKALVNFKKAQSLMARIIKMTEEQKYCIDIMQHNLAVIGLLKSAHQMMMESHLNSCFAKALNSHDVKLKQKMTSEILKVSKLANK
ncbi:MAG: metal-sensing transcriptional repressor [bacterium]